MVNIYLLLRNEKTVVMGTLSYYHEYNRTFFPGQEAKFTLLELNYKQQLHSKTKFTRSQKGSIAEDKYIRPQRQDINNKQNFRDIKV